jgi:hypothetical protein
MAGQFTKSDVCRQVEESMGSEFQSPACINQHSLKIVDDHTFQYLLDVSEITSALFFSEPIMFWGNSASCWLTGFYVY